MKHLLLLTLLTAGASAQSTSPRPQWIFDNAFKCIFPHIDPYTGYNYGFSYGCYCGLFRFGDTFNNFKDLDRCCATRDNCLAQVYKLKNCGSLIKNPYTSSYLYSCSDDEITCGKQNNHCEEFICNCDCKVASCFSKALYHKVLKGIRC